MKKVSWFTPQSVDISGEQWYSPGYSIASLNLIKALNAKEVACYWNKQDIPIHINFCQPYYYQLNNEYNIGYTPWESTLIPEGWKFNMSLMKEIWTTSSFVKEVFESYDVQHDVFVLPHGISDDWSIVDREITKTFNFLHVGGDSKRKNSQMVVDAFLELFDGKEEFRLVLKYNKHSNATYRLGSRTYDASEHPQILGISSSLEESDIVDLYHKCHCMVYPTMGEGFGMIPFQSIATGMPTICTDLTGCKDFAYLSVPLEAKWVEAKHNNKEYQTDTGMWAEPNYESLIANMHNVVNYYEDIKKATIQSAKILHETRSWDAVADMMIARLEKTNYF